MISTGRNAAEGGKTISGVARRAAARQNRPQPEPSIQRLKARRTRLDGHPLESLRHHRRKTGAKQSRQP
jgi:hypothetical protein